MSSLEDAYVNVGLNEEELQKGESGFDETHGGLDVGTTVAKNKALNLAQPPLSL